MKRKCLILNADFTPIKFCSWKNALRLTLIESPTSYVVEYYQDWQIKDSVGRTYNVPAVIALKIFIKFDSTPIPYKRRNVHFRDLMQCAYCNIKLDRIEDCTIDHVIPKSRWKILKKDGVCTNYTNLVTACKRCNNLKGDKTCAEVKMFPRIKPIHPTKDLIFKNRLKLEKHIPKEWLIYI